MNVLATCNSQKLKIYNRVIVICQTHIRRNSFCVLYSELIVKCKLSDQEIVSFHKYEDVL